MDFGLRKGNGSSENSAFAVRGVDADSGEDGAGAHDARGADFFVASINDDVGHGGDGAIAPGLEPGIELLGSATDLGGCDFQAAEVFEDFGHAAGGYALNIHFGNGESECALAALASFQSCWKEGRRGITGLGNFEIKRADAGVEGAWLEAVGIAGAQLVALIRSRMEVVAALDEHGVVDEQAQGIWDASEPVFEDSIEDFRIESNVVLFGHGMCLVFLFKHHQTTCDRTLTTLFFGAIRWPGFLAVPLRSTARNPGHRMVSFAAFTDKLLHYPL